MTTPRSTMTADEEVPKLGSVPPEEEYEVTRVGSRDEIQRALDDQESGRANNLPTPPAPPPTEQMRHVLAGGVVRLAPPPADLLGAATDNMPTKPPTAGLVEDADIDAAFLDPSLASPVEEDLDARPKRSVAPPLPAAARSRSGKPKVETLEVPAFPPAPRLPGALSVGASGAKTGSGSTATGAKALSPTAPTAPTVDGPEDDVDESRSRRIRPRTEPANDERHAKDQRDANDERDADAAPDLAEVSAPRVGRQVLIVAVTIVILVILAMLRR